MTKKLLILGAGNHQVHLIEQAKKMGFFTVVISPEGNYPGLELADKVYNCDVKEVDKIVEFARLEDVEGVLSDQGDVFVKPVAYVAEQLGLPGIGYQTAQLFTNKYEMRRKSEELGLPTIKNKLVTNLEDAEEFFQELGAAAIIKPIDSSGSRGVCKIQTREDLRDKFEATKAYSRNGAVIIEQFVEGPEFEVDSIVFDGECKYMMYADLTEFKIPDVFACTTILFPARMDAASRDRLLALNKATIEGFGLKSGISHAEYIMDRKTGEIYLLEAAARGGGVYISSHIAELQTGLNTAEFLIKLATGELDRMPDFPRELCHCGYVSFYLPVGEVIAVDGIEEVMDLPYVTKKLSNVHVGMETAELSDKRLRSLFFLKADTREELEQRIAHIRQTVKVQVKTASGIQGPIWE